MSQYQYPPYTQTVIIRPPQCSTAHIVIAWIVTVFTGFYMLPWAVAATRSRHNVGSIALLNALLGWSLIGWVVALIWACSSTPPPTVLINNQVAQHPQFLMPPAGPPVYPGQAGGWLQSPPSPASAGLPPYALPPGQSSPPSPHPQHWHTPASAPQPWSDAPETERLR